MTPGGCRPASLAEAVGRLSLLEYGGRTTPGALAVVAGLAAEIVPGATAAAVLVHDGRRLATAAASAPLAADLCDLERRRGHGPCVEALDRRVACVARPLGGWPALERAADRCGVRWVACAPFRLDGGAGQLCCYGTSELVPPLTLAVATAFAPHAGTAVGNALRVALAEAKAAQLAGALATRERVALAKGILMERHGCDEVEALRRLVAASQRQQRKLTAVADELLRRDGPNDEALRQVAPDGAAAPEVSPQGEAGNAARAHLMGRRPGF